MATPAIFYSRALATRHPQSCSATEVVVAHVARCPQYQQQLLQKVQFDEYSATVSQNFVGELSPDYTHNILVSQSLKHQEEDQYIFSQHQPLVFTNIG